MSGISIDTTQLSAGLYTLSLDGREWLTSSPGGIEVFLEGAWRTVKPTGNAQRFSGQDAIGAFNATRQAWLSVSASLTTTIRQYRNAVVFALSYPAGARNTSALQQSSLPPFHAHGLAQPSANFPAFAVHDAGTLPGSAGYRSWQGDFSVDVHAPSLAAVVDQSYSAGPIVLFDQFDGSTLVLSPLNHFLTEAHTVQAGRFNTSISFGPGGELTELPPGFTQEVIVYAGRGITDTVLRWGDALRSYYAVTRRAPDATLTSLGYATDNGAFFYWYGSPPTVPLAPENSLLALDAYYAAEGLPLRYYQLDAWWNACTGWNACCQTFTPNEGAGGGNGSSGCTSEGVGPYFSDGLAALRGRMVTNVLGWSLYHNYACPKSPLWRQNGGHFDGVAAMGSDGVTPLYLQPVPWQSEEFYTELFRSGLAQGMVSTELDYMSTDYALIQPLRTNVSWGAEWLGGLSAAGEKLSVPIQFCMAFPRYILQALVLPAVTNGRASVDFQNSAENLEAMGRSSLFYAALDLPPSKDSFWSSSEAQGASQPEPPEPPWGPAARQQLSRHPNPLLHTVVAAFSTGPVQAGDGVGASHIHNLRATCTANGTLLQPSLPLLAIDATFAKSDRAPAGHVWSTVSTISVLSPSTLSANLSDRTQRQRDPIRSHHPNQGDRATLAGHGIQPTLFFFCLAWALSSTYTIRRADLYPGLPPAAHVHQIWLPGSTVPGPNATAGRWQTVGIWNADADLGPVLGRGFPGGGVFPNGTYASTLSMFSPIMSTSSHGYSLLGEPDKWVAVSSARFSELRLEEGAMSVRVSGAVGERVRVAVFTTPTPRPDVGSSIAVLMSQKGDGCESAGAAGHALSPSSLVWEHHLGGMTVVHDVLLSAPASSAVLRVKSDGRRVCG